ncbi:sensor histidine kinase [Enterococcus sp. LJL98]
MDKVKPRSLRFIWALLLFFLFSLSWYFIHTFYDQQVISQQTNYLEKKADLFLELSNGELSKIEQLATKKTLGEEERLTGLDAKGNILFDTFDPRLQGERSDRPEIQAVLKNNSLGKSLRKSPTLDKKLLYVAVPIKKKNELLGILRIAEPVTAFWPEARQMKQGIFLVYFTLCSLVSYVLYKIIQRRNRPIETILPVLKRMIADPAHAETIIADTSQWDELYQSVNQVSQGLSQTYQSYQATEKQFYFLLEELTIGVFLLNSQHEITFMNQALKEQLGVYLDLLEKESFEKVIVEPELIQMVYQLTEKTPFIHQEIVTQHWKKRLAISLSYFSETEQILGVSYDFTRIHQLEKMQKDFVGNVSHELKTPITSLIGFTETLLDGAKEDPETLTAFLTIMQKEAHRLEKLTQEIILLSKGSEITYEKERIQLQPFFTQMIEGYQTMIQEKNLLVTIEGSQTATFETPLALFYPICKNLIENALHYSLPNGKIGIQFSQEQGLHFSIQDFGIGIATEDLARIFERFYRVDKARTRNTGGSGIGLAIVKDYVERLSGTITVKSHPGIGTTFTVYLPIIESVTES